MIHSLQLDPRKVSCEILCWKPYGISNFTGKVLHGRYTVHLRKTVIKKGHPINRFIKDYNFTERLSSFYQESIN